MNKIENSEELKVWDIVKQYPHELGMILECEDYNEYKKTFYDIDLADEIKITKEQFYIVKNFFNKKEAKEQELIIEQHLVDNCCVDSKGLFDGYKCPHCGECYYREDYVTSTLMYCPPIVKDGKLISEDRNISTIHCHCLNCGKDFIIKTKDNETIIK